MQDLASETGKVFKTLLALLALTLPAAAFSQATIVTVNGRTFEVPAGTQATIVADPNGPYLLATTQVAAAIVSTQRDEPVRPVAYAQTTQPRLDYQGFEEETTGPVLGSGQVLRIKRDRFTGHFIAPVIMNGVRVKAIIDTGASGTILSPEDAAATGADRDVTHSRPGVGIGGYTTLHVTRVRNLEIGGQRLGAFNADIGQQGIPHTLLGQPEIAKLGRLVIEDGIMTIYPKGVEIAAR